MSDLGKKAIKNPYVFSTVSRFAVVFIGFIFTIVLSRYLGATIKGQVAYVSSVTGITSIVFEFGIHQAYPYFRKNSGTDLLPVFMRISLLFLVICAGCSALAVFLLDIDPKYMAILLINPFMVYNRSVSYITLVEIPNKKNATELIAYVLELTYALAMWAFLPASFVTGVTIIAFKDIVMSAVYTFHWRKRIFVFGEPIKKWLWKILRFSFFPMLSLLMTTLNYRVDVIMLEGHVTDAALGVYSVGVQIAERVWLVPDAMKGIMVSKITKGKDAGEVAYVIRICNTACLAILAVIVILGKPFIDIVFGADYSGAYQVTLILLLGAIFMVYYKMIGSYNIVMGKQKVSFTFLLISVAGNVVANYLLIPVMGIYGAGIASVISYSICSLLFVTYFVKVSGIPLKNMLLLNREDIRTLKKFLKKSN